jgi:hypothetical protein
MAEASTDFNALPDDAIVHAFYFLEAEQVCKLAAVSKRVGQLSENNTLWRYLVEKEWGKHTPEQEKQLLEDQIEWEKRIAEKKAANAAAAAAAGDAAPSSKPAKPQASSPTTTKPKQATSIQPQHSSLAH